MRKDYKIICFVKNEIRNNQTVGLFNVFGIRFYPNGSFIDSFIYTDEPQQQVKFGANVDNKFLRISKDKTPAHQSIITNTDEWDILLVSQDCKLPKDFSFNREMLVMYHGSDTDNDNYQYVENDIKDKVRKIKPGHHIAKDKYGYFWLKGIADAWDAINQKFDTINYTQAKEKLIKWFGLNEKLNKALEFLHSCLGGKPPADTKILEEGDEPFDLSNDIYKGESLQEWINKLNNKTGDKYYSALADLRDALLWHAGVTGENKILC